MGRRWTKTIQSRLFWGVKIYDQMTSTWQYSSSRRWHKFEVSSQWSIEAWINLLAKGGGPKKRFQYCLNRNSSEHFLVFPSNPGTFRRYSRWSTLQDNVLLLNDFAEYIFHIGNAHDMHSIIRCGLIPRGRRSLKKDGYPVFFKAVNPMHTYQHQEEVQYDLDKPRIAV